MALFFSRRAYNASRHMFTNNAAQKTRYVTLTDQSADGTIPTDAGKNQGTMRSKARQLIV